MLDAPSDTLALMQYLALRSATGTNKWTCKRWCALSWALRGQRKIQGHWSAGFPLSCYRLLTESPLEFLPLPTFPRIWATKREDSPGLERHFINSEFMLFYQRSHTGCSAPPTGGSQSPVTPDPERLTPLLVSSVTCTHVHIPTRIHVTKCFLKIGSLHT